MRQVGLGHYVACHFPLDVGENAFAESPQTSTAGREA
jgi:hypothetical protein